MNEGLLDQSVFGPGWKTSSILNSKAADNSNASGKEGSNRPFSIEMIELRETPTRAASSD